jgi:class 3 adenylate cyclase
MRLLERLSGLGIRADLAHAEQRRVRLCNQCAVIATLTTLGFGAGFAIASPRRYIAMLVLTLVNATLMASSLLWNARCAHRAARITLMATANAHIALGCVLVGRGLGFQSYFFLFPPVTLLLMPGRADRLARWMLAVASPLLYLFVEHHPLTAIATMPVPAVAHAPLRALASALTFATLALVLYFFYADLLRAEDALAREHERSENLLDNILPRSIARRLKNDKASIADGFAEVSVLFADLVGFTDLSARMPPAELVQLLNRIFSELDDMTEQRGLEKIKTIGDAYMVAAGLPEPRADHAQALVAFALDLLDTVERLSRETGQALTVRIGIHTGPVVAGVIGKRKFIYDLWGDTVNVASRMESHGVPGRVHVSSAVARRLDDTIDIEIAEGRTIQVKGKGEMVTHLVTRRKA